MEVFLDIASTVSAHLDHGERCKVKGERQASHSMLEKRATSVWLVLTNNCDRALVSVISEPTECPSDEQRWLTRRLELLADERQIFARDFWSKCPF